MPAGPPAVPVREHLVALRPEPAPTYALPPTEAERRRRRRGLGIVAGIAAVGAAAIVALQVSFPAERAGSPSSAAEAFLSAAAASEWGEAAAVMCSDPDAGVRGVVSRTLRAADLGSRLPSGRHRVGSATEVSSTSGPREFRVQVLTGRTDVALDLVVVQHAPGDYRVCGSTEPP
jgi:hypothetical protein